MSTSSQDERTLVLIKPDAVRRGLVGEIISRFERKGLAIDALVLRTIDGEFADEHYAEHVEKPFYPPLKEFMTGGPLVALVLSGDQVIEVVRGLVGATDGRRRWPARSAATCPCPTGRTWCTRRTRSTAPSARSGSGSPNWADSAPVTVGRAFGVADASGCRTGRLTSPAWRRWRRTHICARPG